MVTQEQAVIRAVTSIDVARLAGVSQSAVSRAFSPGSSISDQTKQKVLAAAESLGYRPNRIPAIMLSGRSIDAVTFTGAVSRETIHSLMKTTRVFCLPSITASNGDAEGLALVLLEAQASGVPIVTSAKGGTTEGMIDAETGFVFPEKDTEALARHLITILTDDSLATRFGKNARAYVEEKHDVRICTARLEAAYDWACAQ